MRHDPAFERLGAGERPHAFGLHHGPAITDLVGRAASGAARAFPAWSETGPTARRAVLFKVADRLEARAADFTELMREETGATRAWADFNISIAAAMLREAGSATTQISGQVVPSDRPGVMALALRQPVGVVLGIAPWNAPVLLAVRALAMPLACGNTVILKTSEICPRTHQLVGEVLVEAGLDKGEVQVVSNAAEDASAVVEALIAHPAVRRVNFTGSTRVGRVVAEVAARHLKPALPELGGKAPLIVLDTADIGEAVRAAAFGAFMNQGQICMSTERVVVDASLADAFCEALAAKAARLTAGHPRHDEAPLGPVVGADAIARIEGLVKDAVARGARIIAGGRIEGTMMDATVIDHVTPDMRIYAEECFGPVLSIIRVRGEDEAVRVANDTEYGLASAVFGRDVMRALRVAKRIEAGICHINGPTVQDEPQMPFGGMKASGHGRFGGTAAIDEFTELRWITIGGPARDYPI